jgi:predicted TIM-barrel fold metal-dependent hydrolase
MKDLRLIDYRPQPRLSVPHTEVTAPAGPVIEAHSHLHGHFGAHWDERPLSELLDVLDAAGVQRLVDLDGMFGEELFEQHLRQFKERRPERFQVFCGVDWSEWPNRGNRFGEWAAGQLERLVRRGADGLKIHKNFGLLVRDERDALVPIDDRRLDPLWEQAAALHLPITVHIADPVAFFEPIDRYNERYEELITHPEWSFYGPQYPAFATLLEQFARLVANHPATTFIGAHAGNYAENLAWVGALFDRCPNFYIDISERIAELGRQPRAARRFFIQYQDRIMFGTDLGPNLDTYRIYYRFLETEDEYFDYSINETPPQGRWQIYGIHLPDGVLRKVYFENAQRILGQRH